MRIFLYMGIVFLHLASCQAEAVCAKCQLQAAWGLAAEPEDAFDASKIGRFQGRVLSVQQVDKDSRVVEGVYVLLKQEKGNRAVRLGPAWYLKRHQFAIEPYDDIDLIASEIETAQSRPALVAAKAKIGKRSIALRSCDGKPLWSKGKQRRYAKTPAKKYP